MNFKLKLKFSLAISAMLSILMINGCGGDEDTAKSMDQIQKEDGVPIQVETVEYKPFEKYMNYFAKLTGWEEATKGAAIGGKIEKINFNVGDYVEEGQIIVEFPSDEPGSVYETARATFENSKRTYERTKVLLESGETSQANFDAVEAQYLVHKRNYEVARKLIFIEAPFSGTLVDVKVKVGDNVKSEAQLFTIAKLHKMRAKIWITEKEIGDIKKGMKAEMELGGKIYNGRIVEISMAVDPARQAFFADVEFDNSRKELKSGVTVEIKVLVYKNPKALIIPRNLVMNDDGGPYVFVEKDGKAEKRYISNGQDSGIYYEVSGGLQVGDKLVTHGGLQLTDGAKVKVIQ